MSQILSDKPINAKSLEELYSILKGIGCNNGIINISINGDVHGNLSKNQFNTEPCSIVNSLHNYGVINIAINGKASGNIIQCSTGENVEMRPTTPEINTDTIKPYISKDTPQIAKDWLINNPPLNRELSTDYFNRWMTYIKINLPDQRVIGDAIFGKLAKEVGYYLSKSNGKRYYVNTSKPDLESKQVTLEPNKNEIVYPSYVIPEQKYLGESVLYILEVEPNIYKFGVTEHIEDRLKKHYRDLKFISVMRLFICTNSMVMYKVEADFKQMAKMAGILIRKYEKTEIIQTNDVTPHLNWLESSIKIYDIY